MRLKEMLKFCNKARNIQIEYSGQKKYLSDGNMCVFIGDIAPNWRSRDAASALELTDEQLEGFVLSDSTPENYIRFEISKMTPVEKLGYSLECDGTVLQPFMMPDSKIFFVNKNRLKVFNSMGIRKYFFDKYAGEAALYVAVDTFVVGAICAQRVNLNNMEVFTQALNIGVKTSAAHEFLDAGGQMIITDM